MPTRRASDGASDASAFSSRVIASAWLAELEYSPSFAQQIASPAAMPAWT